MATSGDSQWDGGVGDDIPNELDETQSLETCAGHAGSSCAERKSTRNVSDRRNFFSSSRRLQKCRGSSKFGCDDYLSVDDRVSV